MTTVSVPSNLSTPRGVGPRQASRPVAVDPARDSGAGLRTFFRIMDAWGVDSEGSMAILGAPKATFYKWKRNPDSARLSRDQFERLSYVFGIYKALQILLPDPSNADSWVNRPNTAATFAGHRPIELMTRGKVADLFKVRQYLDAERGW